MAGIQARVLAGEEVSAEEYLQFVRYEAAGIADVMEMEQSAVSGKVPTGPTIPATGTLEPCPPDMEPSAGWKASVVRDFIALRGRVAALVPQAVEAREHAAAAVQGGGGPIFSVPGPALVAAAMSARDISKANLPKPPVLPPAQLDDGSCLPSALDWPAWYTYATGRDRVPTRQASAGEGSTASTVPAGVPHAPSAEAVATLTDLEARRVFRKAANHLIHHAPSLQVPVAAWVYAFLLRLETPLSGDMAATCRALLRQLCEWRAWLEPGHGRSQPGLLAALNTLILILCDVFGQGDAWEGSV
ncbi:unnamed protein product [Symbiodinium sp. KB8]|nr:unnamed protein product [Symbiodinium sp. KB8]